MLNNLLVQYINKTKNRSFDIEEVLLAHAHLFNIKKRGCFSSIKMGENKW